MIQHQPKQKIGFLDIIWHFKFVLVFYIFAISCLTFALLYTINAIPEEFRVLNEHADPVITAGASATSTTPSAAPPLEEGIYPERVVISKIGVDTIVNNPTTTEATVLDKYLLRGAVRYPGSGTLGNGNAFIFGHSTGLKLVNNQAFKAFNHLKDLKEGDTITVYSKDKEFTYTVTTVTLVDSNKELVDFSSGQNMLTLSTCNTFGQKQERYVVEALYTSVKNR